MRLPADSEPPIGCRQPLPRYPPIWAKSRQEVCETWDWFRSYQGGVYFRQNEAKGYLLSAFSSKRDGWFHNGKLIISHGGGKAESIHHTKGHLEKQAASDQNAEDFSVRALLKNFRNNIPVALLIDDKYVHFPFSLDARDVAYAVLGFYKITHVWSELQPANNDRGRVVRYKFAFQWYESQGQPWWCSTPEDLPTTSKPNPNHFFGSVYQECSDCRHMSPQVYEIGWMCLQSECRRFWVIDTSDAVLLEQLKYNPAFLELLPNLTLPVTLSIFPPSPPSVLESTVTTTELFARGWHCTKCGRLSCRYTWQLWECAHCKNSLRVQGAIQHARDLQGESKKSSMMAIDAGHLKLSFFLMTRTLFSMKDDRISCLNRGFVHRIKGCGVGMNQEANKIFIKYQEEAMEGKLLFRRWPLRAVSRGELLTHYFSQNSKCTLAIILPPYQYVGGTENTVPWDQAPSAVIEARALMQHRIKLALDDTCESEFNEVLSAAYMQKQKMAGDILVMQGADIQRCYEHTVEPSNFRIAATARYIAPNTLA
ncbi:uncharacterized protein EV420DRAFT_1270141 [Desarmillaria tabescens]|uniref:Alpha-ketoglutarate-dependent dioxygenase AlkB-like domain-containing protein n=1 Tax=Armillaria tabescens TaxID=1929756 RepID=A0AA39N5K1_ARMTA|nr:uncharacterized protein EV420DRAFT_1270141 [Desarmillaria tabescens]KAK0458732.1 hypothetical protein EV420DRAFT_1270141 [Desarmillaria tabescens]